MGICGLQHRTFAWDFQYPNNIKGRWERLSRPSRMEEAERLLEARLMAERHRKGQSRLGTDTVPPLFFPLLPNKSCLLCPGGGVCTLLVKSGDEDGKRNAQEATPTAPRTLRRATAPGGHRARLRRCDLGPFPLNEGTFILHRGDVTVGFCRCVGWASAGLSRLLPRPGRFLAPRPVPYQPSGHGAPLGPQQQKFRRPYACVYTE